MEQDRVSRLRFKITEAPPEVDLRCNIRNEPTETRPKPGNKFQGYDHVTLQDPEPRPVPPLAPDTRTGKVTTNKKEGTFVISLKLNQSQEDPYYVA